MSKKDTIKQFPQGHSAQSDANDIEDYISALTGKPKRGRFCDSVEALSKPLTGEKSFKTLFEIPKYSIGNTRMRINRVTSDCHIDWPKHIKPFAKSISKPIKLFEIPKYDIGGTRKRISGVASNRHSGWPIRSLTGKKPIKSAHTIKNWSFPFNKIQGIDK